MMATNYTSTTGPVTKAQAEMLRRHARELADLMAGEGRKQMTDPTPHVYQDVIGVPRIRIGSVSAEILDPLELIRQIADQAGLEVDDSSLPDLIVISLP